MTPAQASGSGASSCWADFPFVVGTHVCGEFGNVTCVIKKDGVYFNDIKDVRTSATFNLTKNNKDYTIIVENGDVIDISVKQGGGQVSGGQMNIHREMAKYRLICIRAHEQLLRLREVQQENQQNGTEPSWDSEVESSIYCALKSVESKIHNDICDAFDPPNKDQEVGK